MSQPSAPSWALPPLDAFADGQSAVCALGGTGQPAREPLVEEAPITLVFNDSVALTLMATPLLAEELALGFCLSEGLVERASEVGELHAVPTGAGLSVFVELPEHRLDALRQRRRLGAAPGGCGLCGIEDQRSLLTLPAGRLTPIELAEGALARALQALPRHQPLNARTGGAHAAAWIDAQGTIHTVAEDASRHCALDKLIGRLARHGLNPADGGFLVTSRASYELVHKTARVGCGLLAAVSAPTGLAVRAAEACGMALYGFVREGRATRYA
ncbi:formate dehydrogenase accessory sulfurtransferase FdhD [Inhella gelatinilytica]|uniref:Sulfur carrier protein FdhD n=1 Tax=Inhella gelatinilytica TaxID=2795030 RepID=A0A931IT45_9BURK|nr:formate dehydrogenase accessory sulfurtransferase FdhD [Inhella gelatinilytica]MBH9552247.1 formate dehydrogenase accessory sulfurtransferase FdhD [Inhella gelatinilytica]